LSVQHVSHDPIRGAQAFTELTAPITTDTGTRIPGLRFGDPRVHALLSALLIHRLLIHGFTNRDLRTLIAPLLATTTEHITAGKMTYDLRRLRAHGLITRIPRTRRYQITTTGLCHALLFTHAHDHLLRTGLAEITDPDPPASSRLRAADRAYQTAFDELARRAHLTA
jgi:predicted MarR family transcription regulator